VKLSTSVKHSDGYKNRMDQLSDKPEYASDLEPILTWACLAAAQTRRSISGVEKNRGILRTKGESESRLQEFGHWRTSTAFTEREKAALSLGESLSSKQSEEYSIPALKEAKNYFNREEMIRLTLSIMAVNDWADHHSGSSVRVLVVEDDPLDQDLLRRQLQKAQMENNVVFVSNARQALELLEGSQREPFGYKWIAIFLDIHLPGMNGIELLRHIRTMWGGEDIPVIIMSSSRDPRHIEECKRLKVASYVEKPVTYSAFSKAVANIFHQPNVAAC
jgi:two-component system response regulator